MGAALDDVERGELPALVICHGMVIRAALSAGPGTGCRTASACPTARSSLWTRPLRRDDLGGGEATPAS